MVELKDNTDGSTLTLVPGGALIRAKYMESMGPTFETVLDMVIVFFSSGMERDGKLKCTKKFFVFLHWGADLNIQLIAVLL